MQGLGEGFGGRGRCGVGLDDRWCTVRVPLKHMARYLGGKACLGTYGCCVYGGGGG